MYVWFYYLTPTYQHFIVFSIFIKLCEDKDDIKQANHLLYSILHDIDQRNDIVQAYIFGFEKNDNTEAIMNRMLKAAGNQIVNEVSL